jgi:hypothetical protein
MLRRLLGLATTVAFAACSTPNVVTNTNNFERPTDIDFLCLEAAGRRAPARVYPLSECGLSVGDNTSTTGAKHLYALVTQSVRGELAVIDLAAAGGTALFDHSPAIPGYTFMPVGALPTAVVADVRTGAASSIWVASNGDRTLERIDATSVLTDPDDAENRTLVRNRITVPMNGAPRDLAIDTVRGRTLLYATVPDRAAVAVFDVTDPMRPSEMGFVPLTAPMAQDGGLDGSVGAQRAHPGSLVVDTEAHRVYVADDEAPVVHVLEGIPVREVEQIDMGAPTRAITITGWARRLSCGAESVDPDHFARARYLYATHATTGAILVYDLTRRARVRANVLPMPNLQQRLLDPTLDANRVAITSPVVSLVAMQSSEYAGLNSAGEILVPGSCLTLRGCRSAVGPGELHGVFVGAVSRDGRFTVIDIDDYDAPARAASLGVINNDNSGYRFVRHAPRASTTLTAGPRVGAQPGLSALVRGTQRTPVAEGNTTPILGCVLSRTATTVERCPTPPNSTTAAGEYANFGIELAPRPAVDPAVVPSVDANSMLMNNEPVTCADAGPMDVPPFDAGVDVTRPADPYVQRNETWGLTYEGAIPGLDLFGAAFVVDGERLVVEVPGANFCTRGALADDTYARDLVTLLNDPTSLPADAAFCQQEFGSGTQPLRRDFVIDEARQDSLVLRLPTGVRADVVRRCFPQAAHIEVRAAKQWLVVGARSGYTTAVRVGADGRCEVDSTRQTAVEALARACLLRRAPLEMRSGRRCLAGRACMGTVNASGAVTASATPVFANTFFCLQVFPAVTAEGAREPVRDSQFTFAIGGGYDSLRLDVGLFPVAARYLPRVDRFYVIDTQRDGLIEYRTNPLARNRVFN